LWNLLLHQTRSGAHRHDFLRDCRIVRQGCGDCDDLFIEHPYSCFQTDRTRWILLTCDGDAQSHARKLTDCTAYSNSSTLVDADVFLRPSLRVVASVHFPASSPERNCRVRDAVVLTVLAPRLIRALMARTARFHLHDTAEKPKITRTDRPCLDRAAHRPRVVVDGVSRAPHRGRKSRSTSRMARASRRQTRWCTKAFRSPVKSWN